MLKPVKFLRQKKSHFQIVIRPKGTSERNKKSDHNAIPERSSAGIRPETNRAVPRRLLVVADLRRDFSNPRETGKHGISVKF